MGKVSTRGVFGRLFHLATKPEPLRHSAACQDLVRSLDVSGGPAVSADDVRSCAHAVTSLLDSPTSTASERNQLIRDLLDADVPVKLLEALPKLEFEAAKDSMRLFHQILKNGTSPVFDYICNHKQILEMLLDGCGNADVALQSNVMLRSCTKHEQLVEMLLKTNFATGLISLVQLPNFDISSDAFCSLRELLLGCKRVVAAHIASNCEDFFGAYHKLIQSDDYFAKRQALCLLADILLDPDFQQVVSTYASNEIFLKMHMNLLRDGSKAVQLEAFRALRVFVDNPQSSLPVHKILFKNKERLMRLLDSMANECEEADVKDLKAAAQSLEALPVPLRHTRTASMDTTSDSSTDNSEHTSDQQVVLNDNALNLIQWHSMF